MKRCKFCDRPFQWGRVEDPVDGARWVPFVPIEEHDGLDRAFQDENGVLRADHRLVCTNRGGAAVRAVRLARVIPASSIMPERWSEPDADGVTIGSGEAVIEPHEGDQHGLPDH